MLRNIAPASLPVKLLSDLRETATVYQIKNQEDHKKQSYASARVITPSSAIRPGGQGAQQKQKQDDDQYQSKHNRDSSGRPDTYASRE